MESEHLIILSVSTPAKKAAGRFHEKAAEKAAAAYIIIRVGAH